MEHPGSYVTVGVYDMIYQQCMNLRFVCIDYSEINQVSHK